ncbi:MAG: death-on-curing protein [SAR202 cluster bacterium Io17-Chloro-G9]|nr:MAG: death-on-curing protein [SAR202 cluster bacterium Io17-Chloro-G9]
MPKFLSPADVLLIHVDQIERYEGLAGIRDQGLLQTALAMPEASFGGELLHRDLYEMAAAYPFHICQNHPFVDGNKRTGLASALVFLELNGISIDDPEGVLYQAMMDVASGSLEKLALAEMLRELPWEN